MRVAVVCIGVSVDVTVECLDRRTVGSAVIVHHATQPVIRRTPGLHQFDQREVGIILVGVGPDDSQVAVVARVGLSGQDERLSGLVFDAGTVGAYLRHLKDGVVLGNGGGVVLQGDVDEAQPLARPDLEGAVWRIGDGGFVGFGGGFEFLIKRWTMQLDARYNLGLTNVNGGTDASVVNVENRGWSVSLGLGLSFGRP